MKILFNLEQFTPVDAGERVLAIKEAKCVPSGKPTKIEITFEDIKTKRTLKSSYNFSTEGAMRAFGFLCRTALDIPDMGEFDTIIDTPKLIGVKLVCEVVHTEGTQPREDGTFPIFANISKVLSRYEENIEASTATSPRNSIPTGDLD